MRLYIFPGAPTLFYQQGNHNSCILSSLASALHYMGDEYASQYIIRRNNKCILEIHNKVRMQFYCDILIGHHNKKTKKNQYCIDEWHTSTPYYILRYQYTYPTVCLLLDIWYQNDHFITI